jgi:hypothetical protein
MQRARVQLQLSLGRDSKVGMVPAFDSWFRSLERCSNRGYVAPDGDHDGSPDDFRYLELASPEAGMLRVNTAHLRTNDWQPR